METSERAGADLEQTAKRGPRAKSLLWMLPVLVLALLYAFRPAWSTAITYWPPVVWSGAALLLAPLFLLRRRFRPMLVYVGAWLALALVFDDLPRGVLRALLPSGSSPPGSFRIATLNCAGGDPAAAREAADSGAELVLLQESPGGESLAKLAKDRWGGDGACVPGPDCSILAKGKLETFGLGTLTSPRANFVWAVWQRRPGERYFVVSLRLQPPTFRLDYWNPDCWRAYAEDRARRKSELADIVRSIEDLAIPQDTPIIVGGDFNGTPTEGFQDSLGRICQDTFRQAGVGWGGTGTNDYPFVRFDQIWLQRSLSVARVETRRTAHSDHRMVLAMVGSRSK